MSCFTANFILVCPTGGVPSEIEPLQSTFYTAMQLTAPPANRNQVSLLPNIIIHQELELEIHCFFPLLYMFTGKCFFNCRGSFDRTYIVLYMIHSCHVSKFIKFKSDRWSCGSSSSLSHSTILGTDCTSTASIFLQLQRL